jgi:hypothetical protein
LSVLSIFRSRSQSGAAAVLIALALWCVGAARAEDSRIAALRAADRKTFTDAEIIDGFLKTTIGAELGTGGETDRIRKYTGPVRAFIDNHGPAQRTAQVGSVIKDIAAHIRNLDFAVTDDRGASNMLITLVRNRDLEKTITSFYGRRRARQIEHSLDPQCLSGLAKNESFEIVHSEVFLVHDAGEFVLYDCAYEEILQALGPINDTDAVPWTMFNDRVQKGFFDVFDQLILNILYDPRIHAGMTSAEARTVLPAIIPDARATVAKLNGLRETPPERGEAH